MRIPIDELMIYKAPNTIASGTMKILWIGLLILFPVAAQIPLAAQAASLEQSYLAARDAHIRKLAAADKPGADADQQLKLHEAAVADLEKQLKKLVGPSVLTVPGIASVPKINNDTLSKGDQGFGMLDGLAYVSEDFKTRVIVSTEGLFKAWLRGHRTWWNDNDVPQDTAKALRHTSFYTQAMSQDSAVFNYAELPI